MERKTMERETIFRIGYPSEKDIQNEFEYLKQEYGETNIEEAIENLISVQQMDYDYIIDNNTFDNVVLIGTVGLWNGTKEAAKYIKDTNELKNIFSKYDEIEFQKSGKRLYVVLYHHDGRHSFEILRLNDKGQSVLDRMQYFYGENPDLKILDDIDKFKRNYTKCFFNKNKQYLI